MDSGIGTRHDRLPWMAMRPRTGTQVAIETTTG